MSAPHRVVIIGSGFGGLFAAKHLKKSPVEVTLIARTAHHLFQPLLYQVATGVLSEGEIAPATREILRRQKNAQVLLGDVTGIDLAAKTVTSTSPLGTATFGYDSLIVAAGAGQSYFGNDQFADFAPGMKSIDDALELRGRIFGVFELAELTKDPAMAKKLLTFVVVGAGPTGVEMAGQIAELSRRTLHRDFRNIDPSQARIVLLDAAPNVLGSFGDKLSKAARGRLEEMGVDVQLHLKVVDVDGEGVTVEDKAGNRRRIDSYCKVWAAGVAASPLGKQLAEQSGAELDRAGRIKVQPDLTLPGHPEVYVLGDMATLNDYPGVAQVAMQGAKHAAKQLTARLEGQPADKAFRYFDKGNMATVSRFYAVAAIGPLRLKGFIAWLMWLVIHLIYLIGFKHRVTALLHWSVSFIGRGRSERTATLQQVLGRRALEKMRESDANHWAGLGPLERDLFEPKQPDPTRQG
ncbi:NAD(P)/FAD-dependent oxidoreductase [Sporichthya sp.]|uniref:NAD(P)/FAD-dependent oxidoreductase n=1 Tax=Sporichthya sp. TaxID=65475 RepID=UPI0017B9ACBA|nr:NAD(P)/FAD-dependent oxidoreductase [Sporichthya sp.]MBA3743861.1 NAD(P)/FAD-dependent oxidoreductase [Sporichthya sp.]